MPVRGPQAAENAHESLNPLVLLWESEDSDASPEEQLRAELVRLRLWQGRFEAWLSDAAVLAVLATPSVALPSFGLQAAVYQRCVRAASRVVVLSEEADFAMPYEALRVRNVEPLRQAVLFAAASEVCADLARGRQ
jgi:thioester reductase-like protein